MKFALTLALTCLATTLSLTAQAQTAQCQNPSEDQIAKLFDRWNDSLQTGDPKKVVANYAPKSVLLPTVSNTPRLSPESKEEYFEHFLQNKPRGEIVSRSIEVDCNTAFDAGLYTFSFANGNTVPARYTFTYKWNAEHGEWLITSHHSSAMPEQAQVLH